MKASEIEEKRRIAALEREYYSQIFQIKEEMRKTGKQFYTGSFCGHQLIVICTTNGMYTHTIIPCLTYINEVTNN
jgi:transcription elongation factor Elf1